jgi:hypothetical protein
LSSRRVLEEGVDGALGRAHADWGRPISGLEQAGHCRAGHKRSWAEPAACGEKGIGLGRLWLGKRKGRGAGPA